MLIGPATAIAVTLHPARFPPPPPPPSSLARMALGRISPSPPWHQLPPPPPQSWGRLASSPDDEHEPLELELELDPEPLQHELLELELEQFPHELLELELLQHPLLELELELELLQFPPPHPLLL